MRGLGNFTQLLSVPSREGVDLPSQNQDRVNLRLPTVILLWDKGRSLIIDDPVLGVMTGRPLSLVILFVREACI